MVSTIAKPGTKLEMFRLKNNIGKEVERRKYYSKIVDLVDDETVKISVPIENNLLIPLEIGDKYQFIFYTNQGLHQCKGAIMERYKEGLISIALVYIETDVEKYQRRQYYRLGCAMEIQYRMVSREETYCIYKLDKQVYQSEEEKEKLERFLTQVSTQWNLATIIDISGGGCRFNSQLEHEAGEKVRIKMDYSVKEQIIKVQHDADIVYSMPLEKRNGYYEYRIEFDIKDSIDREMLIKFIFEEERKIRKRERGLI